RAFRRTRMAWLPSSRHYLNRSLRIDLRMGETFSPQHFVPPRCSRRLPFPKVTDPEAPPLRPERHIPNSIATMRRRLVLVLVKHLRRCPCCAAPIRNLAKYTLL